MIPAGIIPTPDPSVKDVVPTLEAMQKMIQFYHNKWIDMLKLGSSRPNLANVCPKKLQNFEFFPFCKMIMFCVKKIEKTWT